MISVFCIPFSHLLPQAVKHFLVLAIVKEARFLFPLIKGITRRLMQIEDNIQTIFSAPMNSLPDILKAAFYKCTILILQNIIVYRQTHMINWPITNSLNIFLNNKML